MLLLGRGPAAGSLLLGFAFDQIANVPDRIVGFLQPLGSRYIVVFVKHGC